MGRLFPERQFLVLWLINQLLLTTVVGWKPETIIQASIPPERGNSLQYYLCNDEGVGNVTSDTTLLLSGGVHYLQEGHFCLLQNLNNFRIQGQKTGPRTVIHCHSDSEVRRGIAFFNITNLTLSHIQIINCGREIPSGLPGHVNETFAYLGPRQKAVVIISHCIDVTVESVSIDRCVGFGILFINPLGQTMNREVTIRDTSSQILSKCKNPWNRTDMLCSGSGIMALFDDTLFTDEWLNSTSSTNTIFLLSNCDITNNTKLVPNYVITKVYTIIIGEIFTTKRVILTGGSALAIYVGQQHFHVTVKVSSTLITSNTANLATVVFVHYNTITTGSAELDGVLVSNNRIFNTSGGGLAILGLFFSDSLKYIENHHVHDIVKISRSNFSRNSAFYGGSLLLSLSSQNISDIRMIVSDTVFQDNVAILGSALYTFNYHPLVNSREVFITLQDVTASGNTFFGATDIVQSSPADTGVFHVGTGASVTIAGTEEKGCFFNNNRVTVFLTSKSNVFLRGKISFEENHGYQGGALSLVDNSILFIHNNSAIQFKENTAFHKGGALYIVPSAHISLCAIEFIANKTVRPITEELQQLNISVIFSGNRAMTAGNAVFGNKLYYCLYSPTSSVKHVANSTPSSLFNVYSHVFDFQNIVDNGLSEMNSVEEFICICNNYSFLEEYCENMTYKHPLPVIPGSNVTIFMNAVDIVLTPVASFFYSFTLDLNYHSVDHSVRSLPGTKNCSPVEFTIFAKENITVRIDLYASLANRKTTIELQTSFCPPGFVLVQSHGNKAPSCQCSTFIQLQLRSNCNTTDYTINRPKNYWVGLSGTSQLSSVGERKIAVQFAVTCPIDHCRDDVTYINLTVSDYVCVRDRTGTLCGRCRDGLSSVFGTADCKKCLNQWLATIPLFALIGALMVIASFFLDPTITHGFVNGALFFSNIVTVNANIFIDGRNGGVLYWFQSWINMDIGFPLCFYDGMTETAKLGLQYVFPSYLLLTICLIITLTHRSTTVQRLFSRLDGIRVLLTMFYISFLKLFRTVINTFTYVTIVSEKEEETRVVWFFDGSKQASHPDLLFLIILGSLTLVGFILPYIIFFTFPNYIQRWINSTRLNAYVDASLAPYKDNMRFWFGARLVLTSITYLIITSRGTDNPTLTLTLQLSLLVGFTIIQACMHPFKNIGVAFIDMAFLLNLIALILGTLYLLNTEKSGAAQTTIFNISLGTAFILDIGIVLWHLLMRLRQNNTVREVTDRMAEKLKMFMMALKQTDMKTMKNIIRGEKVTHEGQQNVHNLTECPRPALYNTQQPQKSTVISLDNDTCDTWLQESDVQVREPVLDY